MEGDDLSVVGQSERVVFFFLGGGGFEALRHFCRENLLTSRSVDAISGQITLFQRDISIGECWITVFHFLRLLAEDAILNASSREITEMFSLYFKVV